MSDCSKCGGCCRQLTFRVLNLNQKRIDVEYYKAHGCRIEGDLVIVPLVCPHLTEENLCDIHDKKPFLCKSYKGQTKGYYKPKECTL